MGSSIRAMLKIQIDAQTDCRRLSATYAKWHGVEFEMVSSFAQDMNG
jgi:hypothetical protein